MKLIPLTKGYSAKVDDADYADLSQYKWQALVNGKYVYAQRTYRCDTIPMHSAIMHTPAGQEVHHLDNDGLNNQRGNMVNVTHAEHMARYTMRGAAWQKWQHDRLVKAEWERINAEHGRDLRLAGDTGDTAMVGGER
jgi:hypothetical protein